MSGIDLLVDTNCFIYLLDENPVMVPFLNSQWSYSYITEIELLSKKDLSFNDETIVKEMLSNCFRINHSQALTETTIKLRRSYSIKLPDAIIAASALIMEIPLLTADRQFSIVKELDSIIIDIE